MKVDIKKLEKLLKLNTHEQIVKDVSKVAKEYNIHSKGTFTIFTPKSLKEKEFVPCIVSHTDTVSKSKPKSFKLIDGVLTNPSGVLGADDRAGVYIIYELMKKDTNAIFILTDLEEVGGIGASDCATDQWFQDLSFNNISCLLELDRENSDHCATYGYDNEDLLKIFNDGGYKEAFGSYTDVATLSDACDIACVNLSVGYYNQHTKREYLVIEELAQTLTYMIDIPKELYGRQFKIEAGYMGMYGDSYGTNYEAICCDVCGAHEALYKVDSMDICVECIEWGTDYFDYKEVS